MLFKLPHTELARIFVHQRIQFIDRDLHFGKISQMHELELIFAIGGHLKLNTGTI